MVYRTAGLGARTTGLPDYQTRAALTMGVGGRFTGLPDYRTAGLAGRPTGRRGQTVTWGRFTKGPIYRTGARKGPV